MKLNWIQLLILLLFLAIAIYAVYTWLTSSVGCCTPISPSKKCEYATEKCNTMIRTGALVNGANCLPDCLNACADEGGNDLTSGIKMSAESCMNGSAKACYSCILKNVSAFNLPPE